MLPPQTKPQSDRLVAPERGEDDALEASLRPKRLAEFVGQQQARENLSVFIAAAKARGEALDHVLFSGPPGLGKTTLAQIVARELGVNFRSTSGPVLAQGGRSRRHPDQSRTARRAVHRRNPSPQSGGRGNPLSGDGGFRARPGHRRRAVGALGEDHAGAVHADRRHHALGPHHHAVARPLRHSGAAQFLFGRRTALDRGARRAGAGLRSDLRRRARDRRARARHAAHRRAAAQARARFRLRRAATPASMPKSPMPRSRGWKWMRAAWMPSTSAICS